MFRIVSIMSIILCLALSSKAQEENEEGKKGLGMSLGIRNTYSLFGGHDNVGMGYGGQFRLRPSDRLNTEWYLDYITTNIRDLGRRQTFHIGWSVMFYPLKPKERKLEPYILAGHCFDHAKIIPNDPAPLEVDLPVKERWSSAMQVGVGNHFHLTDNFDITLIAQYMSHLGNDLESEIIKDGKYEYIYPKETDGELSLEGHLLITVGLNIKIIKRQ